MFSRIYIRSLNARMESRENWMPANNGRLTGWGKGEIEINRRALKVRKGKVRENHHFDTVFPPDWRSEKWACFRKTAKVFLVCPQNFAETIVVKCFWEVLIFPRAFRNNSLYKIRGEGGGETEWIMGNWKIGNGSCSLFEKSRAVRMWFSKLVMHAKICQRWHAGLHGSTFNLIPCNLPYTLG